MRILVLQLKRIGDVILTTPALRALREALPGARITLAVESACRELLPAIDCVDETLVYNRAGCNGALWRHLLFHGFDVCLDFTGTDRSALFAVLSKARKRVAFESIQRSRGKPVCYNSFVASSVREHHTIDHYMHMLRALDIAPPAPELALHVPAWAEKKARQLLAESGIAAEENAPFVLVHPGTARPEKYWLPARWAEVINWCERELRLPCVLTGSAEAAEQRHISEIKAALAAPARDLSGQMDLLTLAALVKAARLALTVDSAAMHLAAAFRVPQLALFGPTNPFHWRPRHGRSVVLLASDPARPNPPLAPRQAGAPMSALSTEHVIGAISLQLFAHGLVERKSQEAET